MPEFINSPIFLIIAAIQFIHSPIFLIIAAILGVFLLIRIIKAPVSLMIWVAIIAVILIGLGFLTQEDLRDWIEDLIKRVG